VRLLVQPCGTPQVRAQAGWWARRLQARETWLRESRPLIWPRAEAGAVAPCAAALRLPVQALRHSGFAAAPCGRYQRRTQRVGRSASATALCVPSARDGRPACACRRRAGPRSRAASSGGATGPVARRGRAHCAACACPGFEAPRRARRAGMAAGKDAAAPGGARGPHLSMEALSFLEQNERELTMHPLTLTFRSRGAAAALSGACAALGSRSHVRAGVQAHAPPAPSLVVRCLGLAARALPGKPSLQGRTAEPARPGSGARLQRAPVW